jgi:peptidyl-prolyl cis-trans isomerase D
MLKTIQQKKRGVRIFMGVLLGIISLGMLLYLVPAPVGTTSGGNTDTVATVAGQEITAADVRQTLDRETRGQTLPPALVGLYAKQVLDQMIFQKALEAEAQRLGLAVTPEEETERIKQILPTVFNGDTWMKDRYALEVAQRTGMSVTDFEDYIRQALLTQKFQELVTGGITVTPEDIVQEFRRRNQKVKLDYVLLKPADLAATINPTDAELNAFFEKNTSRYQVAEKRSVRYALLDLNLLRQHTVTGEDEIRTSYNQRLTDYKVPDRVHVEHILFKTVGKTDAEVAEIHKKAEDALKQAKHGASFEDLAKKYSEDTTKDKGGDLGWIVRGQTVAEFEQAAFGLPKGSVSDLVKTQYGFHIIKVLEKETAHTKSLEEVRASILSTLLDQKVEAEVRKIADQMAAAVRRSSSISLEQLAKSLDPLGQQSMVIGETPAVSVSEPVGDLGNSPELHGSMIGLHPGELSLPIAIDRGEVVLTVSEIEPTHQGKFAEVRERVLADYRQEKSVELARSRADELARRVRSGEDFSKTAKALGFDAKTTDPFSRTVSVRDLGPARDLSAAFNMNVGQTSGPVALGANWLVYRVAAREEPNLQDLASQRTQIEQELLQNKRAMAFEAFREALESRMKQEGKLTIRADALSRLSRSS